MYHVYLVDDDKHFLDQITASLPWQDNGFQVVGLATDPATALREIAALRPHVLFTDLKMPGMDGLALVASLRERGIPCECVMLSAYSEFLDTRAFFRMEGFDYLLKPVKADDAQLVLERLGKRLVQKNIPSLAAQEPATSNRNFNELISYLTQNYQKKLTLDGLGKQFGLSPNYICNLFAKNYGTTFTRFVTGLRMKEAKRLMETSNKALKEIAIDCGYSDYYHFFKVFKEYYGVSPTLSRGKQGA